MAKTLEQINKEFLEEQKARKLSIPKNIGNSTVSMVSSGCKKSHHKFSNRLQKNKHSDIYPQTSTGFEDTYGHKILGPHRNNRRFSRLFSKEGMATDAAKGTAGAFKQPAKCKAPCIFRARKFSCSSKPAEPSFASAYTPSTFVPMPTKEVVVNKKKTLFKYFLDILFYTALVAIIIAAIIFSSKSNGGFELFGYSGFSVLSSSMQSEIPRGSLVITKETDVSNIKIGDDITYIRSDNAVITHRVIEIQENNAAMGFRTKGIENPMADLDLVYAANIIGVVKCSIPKLGFITNYITDNIGFVFLFIGGIAIATVAIRKFFTETKKGREGEQNNYQVLFADIT